MATLNLENGVGIMKNMENCFINLCDIYRLQWLQLPWLDMWFIPTEIWVIIHAFRTKTCKVSQFQQSDISMGHWSHWMQKMCSYNVIAIPQCAPIYIFKFNQMEKMRDLSSNIRVSKVFFHLPPLTKWNHINNALKYPDIHVELLFSYFLPKDFSCTIMHSFAMSRPQIWPILQLLPRWMASLVLDWYLHQQPLKTIKYLPIHIHTHSTCT